MIEKAKDYVKELLGGDDSGHGMDHINRVYDLAMKFAQNENCDKTIVALSVLLHDVDDYKLFGTENQQNLTNTRIILSKLGVDADTQEKVLEIVASIGYSKRLKGVVPNTIEGKIVSDADMCDAIGVSGIIRTYAYSAKHGKPFFDRNIWPIQNIDETKYTRKCSDTAVCHMFEKVLKLKNLMLTVAGKQEATIRHDFVVSFLRQLFNEEKAYDWTEYLDRYLSEIDAGEY